ncbi:MAG: C_GCAxxG_C_C family protein [Nitrospirales bacterium]|nr:C_GCAxxG_C_C family protein [Nitrospirales bacterium]
MVSVLIRNGYGEDIKLNCAEKILHGANEVYDLGIDREALKLARGLGGGMGIESVCGALSASVLVMGKLFAEAEAQDKTKPDNTRVKELAREFFSAFQGEMGEMNCKPLKERYFTKDLKCRGIIEKAAEILDAIVQRETTLTGTGRN